MMLSKLESYALWRKHGCYATEICDRCGQLLGAVRFTRRTESGVWCSRECRDGDDAHKPGTCKHCKARLPKGKRRGAMYCDDACKEAAHRSRMAVQTSEARKLSVTKTPIYAAFSQDCPGGGVTGHPGSRKSFLGDLAPIVNQEGVRR